MQGWGATGVLPSRPDQDIKDWHMDFWKELIQRYWSRTGFELRFQVIKRDKVTPDDLATYKNKRTSSGMRG